MKMGLIDGDKFFPNANLVLDFSAFGLNYFIPPVAHVLNNWYQIVPYSEAGLLEIGA